MLITRDEYDRWKTDSVTIEVFQNVLRWRMEKIAYDLASGGALLDDAPVMVGRYKEIEDLMEMKFEDMVIKKEE